MMMALDWLLGLLLLSITLVDCDSKRHFDSSSPPSSVKKDKSCRIGEYGKGATVPKGGLSVDSIEVLAKHEDDGSQVSPKFCYSQCCKLGPALCQYVWVVWDSCFAVSCDGDPDKCRPVPLESSDLYSIAISSLYVKITHTANSAPESSASERTPGVDATPEPNAGTGTLEVDASPVAHAGEDVLIALPQTSVWLYGNGSTDDKGIVYYLWQLMAVQHSSQTYGKTRLLDSTSSAAHVVDLSPGKYTFSLTVLDSRLQSSSDSVQVTVLAGSHDSTVGVAFTDTSLSTHEATGNLTLVDEEASSGVAYSKKKMMLKVLLPVLIMFLLVLIFSAAIVLLYACFCGIGSRKTRIRQLHRYRPLTATIEDT